MDCERHSLNLDLLRGALDGDDKVIRRALLEGADINALDAAGRTTIMCAVAGEHWQNMDAYDASFLTPNRLNAIRVLLTQPDISLLTLNTPQSSMNGVIPLGMAAWLNQPEVVRVLLEDGADSVSVDGMDSHGATALMYAARDGSLEIVQLLLSHGARPDFRDHNHRTSIQFSLCYPRILWLCETILRRHRWHESKSADRTRLSPGSEHLVELAASSMPFSDDLEPPPLSIFTQEATTRLTTTLISSIRASDLAFIHSLLFSPSVPTSSAPDLYPMSVPVLVNLPDSNGWSLIHHCAASEEPSLDILDALYCAGADVSLFTLREQQTALHILAHYACTSTTNFDRTHSFRNFAMHLIQNLRAPLAARDKNDETCIHIAAEHGNSLDLLILFLACDTTGAIREFKNSRGMTAFEVAKSEYLHVFGNGDTRPTSALSNRTIRPTESFASLASVYIGPQTDSLSICSNDHFDIDGAIHQLLTTLRITSPSASHRKSSEHIKYLKASLAETTDQCNQIVQHFRNRINEATRVVSDLQKNADRIDTMRDLVAVATKGKLISRSISPKKNHRDSEDSQMTAVSLDDVAGSGPQPSDPDYTPHHTSIATQTALVDHFLAHRSLSSSAPTWLERLIQSPDSTTYKTYFDSLREVEWEFAQLQKKDSTITSPSKTAIKFKQLAKKKRKLEEKIRDLQVETKMERKDPLSGTSRVKAWLKRMIIPAHPSYKLEFVLDVDEKNCEVGREVQQLQPPPVAYGDAIDASIDNALKTSQVVLEAVRRDLQSIKKSLVAAEQFINMANHSVLRLQRVVKRAVKKRQTMIADLRASLKEDASVGSQHSLSPVSHPLTIGLSQRASLASITTMYSNRSSVISVAATLTEHDDEDTRIIRRLLLRKIEAQTSGVWDEVDNVTGWLQIVKEAVRGVKRRAYL